MEIPPSVSSEFSPAEGVRYEAVLQPHRSLQPIGFLTVMLAISGISFVTGMVFVLMGAWPVTGFFGLDVLLLYLAFRMSYRSGRAIETLRLTENDFTVERTSAKGEKSSWRFQPFWLRVRLIEKNENDNRLVLTSHGRSLAIAGFLTPQERRGLAAELEGALTAYRAV